jgi:hypothetical protein
LLYPYLLSRPPHQSSILYTLVSGVGEVDDDDDDDDDDNVDVEVDVDDDGDNDDDDKEEGRRIKCTMPPCGASQLLNFF